MQRTPLHFTVTTSQIDVFNGDKERGKDIQRWMVIRVYQTIRYSTQRKLRLQMDKIGYSINQNPKFDN